MLQLSVLYFSSILSINLGIASVTVCCFCRGVRRNHSTRDALYPRVLCACTWIKSFLIGWLFMYSNDIISVDLLASLPSTTTIQLAADGLWNNWKKNKLMWEYF